MRELEVLSKIFNALVALAFIIVLSAF